MMIVSFSVPDLGGKTLAKLSAKEYPRHGIDYSKYKEKDDTFRLIRKPLYMRPINKGGLRIERPRERPKYESKQVSSTPTNNVHYVLTEIYRKY